jgi:uncharacterized protein (DUF58 family)
VIPSRRAVALLAACGLVVLSGLVVPWLTWVGLGLDALVLVLVLVDALRARSTALDVTRSVPPTLHQDEDAEGSLDLSNPSGRRVHVRVREVLTPDVADAPLEFEQWLGPRSRTTLTLPLTPRRRGPTVLPPVAIRVTGPFGLGVAERRALAPFELRILPTARLAGEQGLLIERALTGSAGVHARQRRGHSTELYALREYQSGDAINRIHWRASARRGKPVTRETIWEQHQHVVVLLDAGRPMAARADHRSKLDHAIAAALALLRIAVRQNDAASLVLYSRELRRIVRVDKRTRSFRPAFEALHAEDADLQEPDLLPAVAWCAHHLPRRSLVLVVTSVLDAQGADRLVRGLGGLAKRHRPVLVNLSDPGLVATARCIPETVAEAAAKTSALTMLARLKGLATTLRGRGVEVVEVPADRLAMGLIEAYFRHKQRKAG